MWVAGTAIAIGVGIVIVIVRTRPEKEQHYVCWDAPTSGPPASYQVTFDGVGPPLVTTGECVRLPELSVGDHVAEVRAVNAEGRVGPAAVVRFAVPVTSER